MNAVNVAISTNVSIGGTLSVTGNISVGGTLTYEDVTNIDSVGIITAREGIKIPDDKKIIFGTGEDGHIESDGANFLVQGANNGTTYLRGPTINIAVNGGSGSYSNSIVCDEVGGSRAQLFFSNSQKLVTTNTGVTVTGTLVATTFSGSGASLTNLPAGNLTGTLPAISGANLTGIAVTEAPVTDYTISANGSSAYRIHGGGVDETANSPDLYLIRGQKYRFNNTTGSGHPFAIRVSNGGSAYTDGVSGSQSGIQFFTVPYAAPSSLVYQCTIHGGMIGNIYIRGGSSTVTVSGNGNNRVITGGSGGSLVAEDSFLYNGADEVSINHVSTSENSYLTIAANANRRKTLQFKNGSTLNGCIGLGDSDEGVSTSLFLSAKSDPGGASPHMVIDSGGQFCLGTYNSNYGSNDGIVSIVNAANSGTENTLLTLWNPNTTADARAGIDFLTNAQSGTGRDGAFIRGSNDGVTAKANLQFGTIKDETYSKTFELKSNGDVDITGTLRTNRILPVGGAPSGGGGGIIQVKQTVDNTTETITDTNYNDAGSLSVSITPKFSSSKILIMATTNIQLFRNAQEATGGLRLLRDSTEIIEYPYAFVLECGTSGNGRIFYNSNHSATYLDSPNTTSAVTYKVQLKVYGTSNNNRLSYNQNSSKSTILVMEVSA